MIRTRLFLARHGEVVDNHKLTFNGHSDVDITEKGKEQMERLAEFLSNRDIDSIYCSDLRRAYKGAEIVAGYLGLEYEKVSSLREINLGRWDGLTMEEVQSRYPDEAKFRFRDLASFRIKGGENIIDLSKRVVPTTESLLDRHRGGNLLIIAHGGVNRVILCNSMGLPLEQFYRIEQDYGCLNVIDYFDDFALVKIINGGPNQELTRPIVF